MQSYSTSASRDVTNFFRYGKKLDRLVKKHKEKKCDHHASEAQRSARNIASL